MIRESVTVAETIQLLNEIIAIDPTVMTKLVATRIKCNDALANHPTIQCGPIGENKYGELGYEVGFLGILNGLFGADEMGWGIIGAAMDETTGSILHFERIDRTKAPYK